MSIVVPKLQVQCGHIRCEVVVNKFGKTRLGKDIVLLVEDDSASELTLYYDFTIDDHFDAYAVFEYLALREKRRSGEDSLWFDRFLQQVRYHSRILNKIGAMRGCALRAKAIGAFKLRDHGQSLATVEYRDL